VSLAETLLFAAPLLPLAFAMLSLVPRLRPMQLRLLWLAPLPGLAAALLLPAGMVAPIPGMLLGAGLMLDTLGRLFLGMTSLIWLAAGWHAMRSIRARPASFSGFWLLTLAGNMLAIVSGDVVSFYLGFAMLSLAAWGLVIHSGTPEARRAGRVYIRLAVLGETMLVMAMMFGAATAGSVVTAEVQAALGTVPDRGLAIGLLIAGFGIKAGLMPLHVWLPLAHPAAPVPASAVLSGAIVKAGILGLMRFLPFEAGAPAWGEAMLAAGLATSFLGALFGMTQARAKTALAYSTLSQMGLLVAALGAGLLVPSSPETIALLLGAVGLYALHHGLAKAALFLAVDAIPGRGRWAQVLALVTALGVAGLPLSGGALAKAAIKPAVGDGTVLWLFAFSAVTTTILMLHAWRLIVRTEPKAEALPPALPFALLATAAPLATWGVGIVIGMASAAEALSLPKLVDAAWPVAAGSALFLIAIRAGWRWPRRVPEGDLVLAYEAMGRWLWLRMATALLLGAEPRRNVA
ncbi:MAG: complex I subunit 5 family protein, partial [Thermaurantiacus sp.]